MYRYESFVFTSNFLLEIKKKEVALSISCRNGILNICTRISSKKLECIFCGDSNIEEEDEWRLLNCM